MNNIKIAETIIVESKEELLDYHKHNLELGFEGTMIRLNNNRYE